MLTGPEKRYLGDKSFLPSRSYVELTLAECPACYKVIYPDGHVSCRFQPEQKWWSPYWRGPVQITAIRKRTIYVEGVPSTP